jgi:hypothetical protein
VSLGPSSLFDCDFDFWSLSRIKTITKFDLDWKKDFCNWLRQEFCFVIGDQNNNNNNEATLFDLDD